jgi:mRNA-degrading endonuclease YafQ of YafQ-DinJ toxin-antitoxin module
MKVALTDRFQADVRGLDDDQRRSVFDAILALPKAIGAAHLHLGLGLRKLHASGFWEARVGLGLRLVFAVAEGTLTLVRVGTHEDVRRFLKSL